MTTDSALSQTAAGRDREAFARLRHKSEARLARERARNTRLALLCYGLLAALLACGHYFGWTPNFLTTRPSPAEAAAKRFTETRTGQVLFNSADGAVCRELKFNNDTGKFTPGRTAQCDEFVNGEEAAATPGARVQSIREGFSKR